MVEKPTELKAYSTLNFCEKVLTAYTEEEISAYNAGFLKLFKWLKMAIEARKAYITRVKALTKRAKEERNRRQEQAKERLANRENFLLESIEKFNEEHKDEIIAYEEYQEMLRKKENDEYGEEAGSANEEDEEKEPPVKPLFNEKEVMDKFDEDNPEIEIPPEVVDSINNDWTLSEEEEQKLVEDYWAGKPE